MNHLSVTKFGQFCLAFTLTTASGFVGLQAQVPADSNPSAINVPDKALDPAEAQARQDWRETMHALPAPASGCFHASFPNTQWEEVECEAPSVYRSVPPTGIGPLTAGNSADYVAQAPAGHHFLSVLGEFPAGQDVKSETDFGEKNNYSLQLNTNFDFNSPACDGYSGCVAWQQYLLVTNYFAFGAKSPSGKSETFIQDWLLNYGVHDGRDICPAGFTDTGAQQGGTGDNCARNSKAVVVHNGQIPIADLGELALGGIAQHGGNDEVVTFFGNDSYKVSTPDKLTDLSTGWSQAEFNVVGNGGGSKAVFNNGAELLVALLLDYGSSSTPKCEPPTKHLGTTAETNNLNLGACVAKGGKSPYIEFEEGN
jgi:hypothetical protein